MRRLMAAVVVLCAGMSACAADQAEEADATVAGSQEQAMQGDLSAEDASVVASVRETATAWANIENARAAGYTNQYPEGCIENEDGSQGFHFLNDALVDNAVDLHQPELLMYEPQADGSMQLIGVDYVIPFDEWTAAEPPELLGRPFMRNEPLGVWALHIWTHRDNPSGTFAMFNPDVSCVHAASVTL